MSGLGSIFNIAGSALSVHQYGVEVTANNIANVDTPGYTRQTPQLQAATPEQSGNLLMGRGVDIESVAGATDQFVEKQLNEQKSNYAFYQEQNSYVERIEQIFSTSSDADVSSMLSTFWNSWQEVSNNPSGTAERIVLSDNSALLSESFARLDTGLEGVVDDLNDALNTGINDVNVLTRDIADLNQQIVAAEAGGNTAHTLRDLRNTQLGELSAYMEISTFETDDGALTVMSSDGTDLVRGNRSFDLKIENDRVKIAGSGDQERDITDGIKNGKIGGWLDMRDDVVGGYQTDLDALAHSLIWQVNAQHSQGAGLDHFVSVTGTYAVTDAGEALSSEASGLIYSDEIKDQAGAGFKMWVYDDTGQVVADGGNNFFEISIDEATTLNDLAVAVDGIDNISATVTTDNTLEISGSNGYTFAFSDDTGNVLAALGINTFFIGESAGNMGVNDTVQSGGPFISAGTINADGSVAASDNENAMALADLQFSSTAIGNVGAGGKVGALETTTENYYHTMLGSMGTTFSGITSNMKTGEVMVRQLNDMRESISGVSLDEEMVNLMSYQSAYASAAKLITTADEMMQTLLGLK